MKLNLTKEERKALIAKGTIMIEREQKTGVPTSSIAYGLGNTYLWDKVDRVWVYGDTDSYKADMMNIGRRRTDYPNNGKNINSGNCWWECEKAITDLDNTDKPMTNGIKNPLTFQIRDMLMVGFKDFKLKDRKDFDQNNKYNVSGEMVVCKVPILRYTISLCL